MKHPMQLVQTLFAEFRYQVKDETPLVPTQMASLGHFH